MTIAIKLIDETSSGQRISETIVRFPSEQVSVLELIESRVTQEVEEYNIKATGKFNGLVQPSESEKILNGFKLSRGRRLDVEKQKKIAIEAFSSNGFFLLINAKQLTSLDEVIIIAPNTSIVFMKLVPLAGG